MPKGQQKGIREAKKPKQLKNLFNLRDPLSHRTQEQPLRRVRKNG
jgi:hypothetical protein